MRLTVLFAGLLLLTGAGTVLVQGATDEGWRAKADPWLLEAAGGDPAALLSVVVQGPPLTDPDPLPATRAAWKAHWAAGSAPFLGEVERMARQLGGEVTSTTPAVNAAHVLLRADRVPDLVGHRDVRLAGLDWDGATFVLDEPGVPSIQVALDQTITKVQAQDLWAAGYRGEGVKLAIIDTGIRHTHEMMKNADGTSRVTQWFDATSANCAAPCDTNGHGTHVATTAAGSNLFNTGSQQGVAPRAEIYGVKIFIGGTGTWQDGQEGLQGAFDLGAEITSNSWGGSCGGDATVTANLAQNLTKAGMINVFAAGNSGTGGVICPGVVDNVVTVGAIDINENIAGFSSRGPCTWEGVTRICPDIVAVGVDVNAGWYNCDTCYSTISGTSMATPHVAGVVALLQQAKKATQGEGMSAAGKEPEILLKYSAKDLGPGGPDNDYGWGLAKGKAALDLLGSSAGLNLLDSFSAGKPEMRAYETNNLAFAVVNLGGVEVTGRLTHRVEQVDTGLCPPTCVSVQISDRTVSLGKFQEVASSYGFSGAANPAGTYRVEARFDYTYTDPADGQAKSGSIAHEGQFLLKKVAWVKTRLAPADATTGDLILGGVVLRNVGNENATNVQFRETFNPTGFAPAPAAPPAAGVWGALANPAPDVVDPWGAATFRRMSYEWNTIGEVKYGTQWAATYNFVAASAGSYVFDGDLAYQDETGRQFLENMDQAVVVRAPV